MGGDRGEGVYVVPIASDMVEGVVWLQSERRSSRVTGVG